MSSRTQQRQSAQTVGQTGSDPWVMAAAGSVVLSLVTFFVARDRETGIFVGLWAPTILAFASYFNQREVEERLNRAMEGSGVIERVEKIVQGR